MTEQNRTGQDRDNNGTQCEAWYEKGWHGIVQKAMALSLTEESDDDDGDFRAS